MAKLMLLANVTLESQGLYGLVALAPYSSLFGLVASDILLGLVVGLVALQSRLAAALLADGILLFYVVNAHYANLFGAYLGLGLLQMGLDFADLGDSIMAEIKILLLMGLVALVLTHRVLAARLAPVFERYSGVAGITGALVVLLFVGLRFADFPTRFAQFRTNPLEALLASSLHGAGEAQAHPMAMSFVDRSPFPAGVPPRVLKVEKPPKKLNVVLLQMESTGSIAARRPGAETMPVAKALARNGITWTSFYASIPSTMKSYYSLQCGVYPAAGTRPITITRPRVPCKGIAEFFAERGYRTGLFHGGNFSFTHKLAFLVDRGWDVLLDAKTIPGREKYERRTWGIDDKAVFDAARGWIAQTDEPFFALIAPILPHHPYDTPAWWSPRFPTAEKLDRYHNSLAFEDELLGNLVNYLKSVGRFEDTLFVLVGDHGEAFNEHPFNFFHPVEIYEENIRVPFIMSNPGLFPEPLQSDVSGILPDLLPTLLDVLDFEAEGYSGDGISLLQPDPDRLVYFHTTFNEPVHGLRDGRFKFVYRPRTKAVELYDIDTDPGEQENVAEKWPKRVQTYISLVEQWVEYSRSRLR